MVINKKISKKLCRKNEKKIKMVNYFKKQKHNKGKNKGNEAQKV